MAAGGFKEEKGVKKKKKKKKQQQQLLYDQEWEKGRGMERMRRSRGAGLRSVKGLRSITSTIARH